MKETLSYWQYKTSGLQVVRISFDFAISLDLVRGDTNFLLQIEGKLFLEKNGCQEFSYSPPEYINTDPLIALLQSSIEKTFINVSSGKLTMHFSNGFILSVPSDEQYEAWNLTGNDQSRLVCLPGGEFAIWRAEV